MRPDLRFGLSASDRERPLVTGVNGPLMARRTAARPALRAAPWSSPVLLGSCQPLSRGHRVKVRGATAATATQAPAVPGPGGVIEYLTVRSDLRGSRS
jgi:hypothetical protein